MANILVVEGGNGNERNVGTLGFEAPLQSAPAAGQSHQETQKAENPVQEVGGRLVVSGETVLVTADPDRPPQDSSVASKIDTPLLETPRSVSITDRQTLDDLSAINISQAHDYTVGTIPLDERGPASARGFPIDFYDLRRDGLRTYSWTIAGGVVHVSDRFTGGDNVVVAPVYTRADATAFYEIAGPRLTLGLSAQNLTNRRYVTSGAGRVFFAGPPRRLALQMTSAF